MQTWFQLPKQGFELKTVDFERTADAAMYRAKRSGSGYALASSRGTLSPNTRQTIDS